MAKYKIGTMRPGTTYHVEGQQRVYTDENGIASLTEAQRAYLAKSFTLYPVDTVVLEAPKQTVAEVVQTPAVVEAHVVQDAPASERIAEAAEAGLMGRLAATLPPSREEVYEGRRPPGRPPKNPTFP